MTPFPVPQSGMLHVLLLPPWGKVGKGVITILEFIVLFMIADTHFIK
jgi:hypothetical protein